MRPYVFHLDPKQAKPLLCELKERGFTITTPNYTFFAAKKPHLSCTFYTSGKLCIQGKKATEFVEFFLEPEFLKEFHHTHVDIIPHIGTDEAGKGDVFGPLCIAGVFADKSGIEKLCQLGVADSKRLPDSKILTLSHKIEREFPNAILSLYPWKYNELYAKFRNLNHLLAWAHSTVIEKLVKDTKCKKATVDQFARKELLESFVHKKCKVDLTQRTKGESDPVVAAASILARAAFVKGLKKLNLKFAFSLPKGATENVIHAGKDFVAAHGQENLSYVAKLHFKTLDAILKKS